MCNFNRNCLPQQGGGQLDSVSQVMMYRLQYRNFGTHESLVGNFTVDSDGTDHAGSHWFELRKSGANPWTTFQEGTIAPDANHRWMGSAAMDGDGNIAVGYSMTSATMFPSLRYTGRLATDAIGTMPQGEFNIVDGTGNQVIANRWGDYSQISVDPVDDHTFCTRASTSRRAACGKRASHLLRSLHYPSHRDRASCWVRN